MDKIDTIILHCSATRAGRGKAAGGKKKKTAAPRRQAGHDGLTATQPGHAQRLKNMSRCFTNK